MLDFFLSLKTMQISIMPRECENESSVCDGLWPVVWEEVLLRLNWVLFLQFLHSQNIFSENLRKVKLTPRRDVKSSEEYETVYLQEETRRWTGTNGLWLQRRIFCFWRSQYQPLHVDAEIQTDLIADCKEKLEDKTQVKSDLYIEDLCKNDHIVRFTLAFHHWLAYVWCLTGLLARLWFRWQVSELLQINPNFFHDAYSQHWFPTLVSPFSTHELSFRSRN